MGPFSAQGLGFMGRSGEPAGSQPGPSDDQSTTSAKEEEEEEGEEEYNV